MGQAGLGWGELGVGRESTGPWDAKGGQAGKGGHLLRAK